MRRGGQEAGDGAEIFADRLEIDALQRLLHGELAAPSLGLGDVWFARRIDIARWWLAHHEEFER